MTEFRSNLYEEVEIAHTAAIIENELRNGGFLLEIALAKVDALPENTTPEEIAEIILPEPEIGESLEPRWTLVDKAEAAEPTKTAIAANRERIISTVEALGLRKIVYGERQTEDDSGIDDPEKVEFLVESGANKTSVVRRGVATKEMHKLFGEDLSTRTLYQLGGDRIISPMKEITKPDGTKETVPNAEHKVVLGLAGDFLLADKPFTEFEANVATARAEGYEISTIYDTSDDDTVSQMYELAHADTSYPKLVIMWPTSNNLEGGFDALKQIIAGKQLVLATNGQYRRKDEYQAELWAKKNSVDMLSAVAIGDEPGDSFPLGEEEIVVPNRPEAAYINELIVLRRLAMMRLPDLAG